MTNAKKLVALVLVLVLAFSLVSCGAQKEDTAAEDTSAPASDIAEPGENNAAPADDATPTESDKPLNVGVISDPGSLYPLSSSGGFVAICFAFYETLWDYKPDGTKEFILAEDLIEIDPTHYTLKIRQGITFTNGNPLTADDVLFSMELCRDDPRFYLGVKVVDFEKTKVVDDYTIDLYYTQFDACQDIGYTQVWIMDKESFDLEELSNHPNGTGPYTCDEYVVNSHVKCTAKEDYWGGTPYIKDVTFKVINEAAQVVNALETGDIDMVSQINVDDIDYVESLGNYDVITEYYGTNNTAFFSFRGALATKEARWAVAYAIDNQAIDDVVYSGRSEAAVYPCSLHHRDYEDRFYRMHDTYAENQNLEKAKQYAEQSGLVGQTLKIITNGTEAFNDCAAVIQENLRAIGVESEIVSLDNATYFSIMMDETQYDIAIQTPSGPSKIAADALANYPNFIPLGWTDETREEYRVYQDQLLTTADAKERGDIVYKALEIFCEQCPWYALNEVITPRVQSKDLGGVEYYLSNTSYFHKIFWK